MTVSALIGLQWGDEGKGKVVDALSAKVDMVVRCQGGANAGHTVVVGDQKRVLRLVPSGMLYAHVQGIIGNGVVVDPVQLQEELGSLEAAGYALRGRLRVSERAHAVMPYHKEMDNLAEELRGDAKLGTTGRGIGPAYSDKAARNGVVMGDFVHEARLIRALDEQLPARNRLLAAFGRPALQREAVLAQLLPAARALAPLVCDTFTPLHEAVASRREIWLEGAQGAMLDLDFGTYPFVTSSNTSVGGLLTGCGLAPRQLDRVVGVVKAYCTRVGAGPFPTEDHTAIGETIRKRGNEVGAVTGRPRRCGWFDAVAVRHAIQQNGVDELTLTKSDVLSGLDEVKICVAYRIGGVETTTMPTGHDLAVAEPLYRTFNGWKADLSDVRHFHDLPRTAQEYIAFLESCTGVSVTAISTGPERGQIFRRGTA